MKIYKNISELVGNTPLVEVSNYAKENNCNATILCKLEGKNPAGSAKDRVAKQMIEAAEKNGTLKKGSAIIEPTSGNTGIGLAAIAASKGYKVVLTMPETMSIERRKLLAAYGAEIILTEGTQGMAGAIEKANQLAKEIPGGFVMGQFVNPANAEAHFCSTGPEIWEDTEGKVDIFVAGIGTGGTITGIGEYLKSKNPDVKIVGVEPFDSPFLTEGKSGAHGLQGIGAGFVPEILNTEIYDEIITVKTPEAYGESKRLATTEGFLTGITSGAALYAARILANRPENKGKMIVALLPDTGDRYLSTPMFD